MAILESLPGVQVTVRIDDDDVEEYEDDESDDAPNTVSKYIESVTNVNFRVRYQISHPFVFDSPNLSVRIFVDGIKVDSSVMQQEKYHSVGCIKGSVSGVKTHNDLGAELRKFKFSEIRTTIDDEKLATIKEDTEEIRKVGEIDVKIYRMRVRKQRRVSDRQPPQAGLRQNEVHEKALKGDAKSHGVSFDEPSALTASSTNYKGKYLDGRDKPIATFRFKYRSKESLKQLLIIERTPEPEDLDSSPIPIPNPSAINLEGLSQDQQTQLERFLQNLTGNSDRKIKREIKRESDEGESSSGPRKRIRAEEVETIDLTGDD